MGCKGCSTYYFHTKCSQNASIAPTPLLDSSNLSHLQPCNLLFCNPRVSVVYRLLLWGERGARAKLGLNRLDLLVILLEDLEQPLTLPPGAYLTGKRETPGSSVMTIMGVRSGNPGLKAQHKIIYTSHTVFQLYPMNPPD